PQAADGPQRGLYPGDDRHPFARRRDDGVLEDEGGLVDPAREIGDETIDFLRLHGPDHRRPVRFVGDRRRAGDERTEVFLHRRREIADLPGDPREDEDGADLHDRHQRGRGRDDGEEGLVPVVHIPSPGVPGGVALRAWLYASRPRSNALESVSRCRFHSSRPWRAASPAFSRPSRAFSASRRRVSSPLAGATSSATAAPVIAPSTNATTTVPAPLSSRAMNSSFAVSGQKMLTLTLRYFFGSFRMSAMSPLSSPAAEFILSYISLLCRSWPAVPSPALRFFVSSSRRFTVLFNRS